jgi:Ser/Thr protein kinase RdoA (MazF antagonist)
MAFAALEQYPLDVLRVSLLSYGYNVIFRLDCADGLKRVLRINQPIGRSAAFIAAEMAWLAALSEETDLVVPTPVPNVQGELLTRVQVDGVPEARWSAVFDWVPGRDLRETMQPEQYEQLGMATARLHLHAASFRHPSSAALPDMRVPFLPGHDDMLQVAPRPAWMGDGLADILPEIRRKVEATLARIYREAVEPARILHADLHQSNVRFHRGQITILDFDDCFRGHPVQDLGITLYYLQSHPKFDRLRQALQHGYEQSAPWPETTAGDIDALISWRSLTLLNYLAQSENSALKTMLPRFAEQAETHFRSWLAAEDRTI